MRDSAMRWTLKGSPLTLYWLLLPLFGLCMGPLLALYYADDVAMHPSGLLQISTKHTLVVHHHISSSRVIVIVHHHRSSSSSSIIIVHHHRSSSSFHRQRSYADGMMMHDDKMNKWLTNSHISDAMDAEHWWCSNKRSDEWWWWWR